MMHCLIRFCVLKETLSLAAEKSGGKLDTIHEVSVKYALKEKGAAKASSFITGTFSVHECLISDL